MVKKKDFFVVQFIIFLSVFIVLSAIFISKTKIISEDYKKHFLSFFMNLNTFEVIADKSIDKDKVIIKWQNRIIFKDNKYNNENINLSRYTYGINNFKVLYSDKLVGEFDQFKENNWYYYEYKILLIRKEKIYVDLQVNLK